MLYQKGTGKEGFRGQLQMWYTGNLRVGLLSWSRRLSAAVFRPNSTENSPWHKRESGENCTFGFLIQLVAPSIIVWCSQYCTRRYFHLSKSLCWRSCMSCSPTLFDPPHFVVWEEHTGRKCQAYFPAITPINTSRLSLSASVWHGL